MHIGKTPRGFELVIATLADGTKDGFQSVVFRKGPLSIHKNSNSYDPWVISQLHAGKIVMRTRTKQRAVKCVNKLLKLADWDKPGDEVNTAEYGAVVKKVERDG